MYGYSIVIVTTIMYVMCFFSFQNGIIFGVLLDICFRSHFWYVSTIDVLDNVIWQCNFFFLKHWHHIWKQNLLMWTSFSLSFILLWALLQFSSTCRWLIGLLSHLVLFLSFTLRKGLHSSYIGWLSILHFFMGVFLTVISW